MTSVEAAAAAGLSRSEYMVVLRKPVASAERDGVTDEATFASSTQAAVSEHVA